MGLINIKEVSLEWLLEKRIAIQEGRYPINKKQGHQKVREIIEEIRRRTPIGTILVWNHKEVRH